MTNYTGKEIDRKILKLAWPAILSNISVPILGISDTFISGHLGSERFLAAIAVATTMVNSLFWLFGFLRMGTTGLTATAFGAGDDESQDIIFTRALVIATISGAALIALCYPLFTLMRKIMLPPDDVAQPAFRYFMTIMLSAPATLATMAAIGRLIGRQNTLYPMIISISVNVINILLSMTFVFVCGMGFGGVALGTASANWIGLAMSLYFVSLQSGRRNVFKNIRRALDTGGWNRFFSVNGFLFIRSLCMMTVTFAMTAFASRIGTVALAVNAVILQFFTLFSYFMDGFAFSGEALCGRFFGAGDIANLRLTVRRLLMIGVLMTIFFAAIYGIFTPAIATFMSESDTVRQAIAGLRVICVLLPVASVAAFIFDGIYIGVTRTIDMMYSTLTGMVLFFTTYVGGFYLGMPHTSMTLWMSFLLFLMTRGAVLAARLRGVTDITKQPRP